MGLESMLISDLESGKTVDIERALLIISGLDSEQEIQQYKAKIDEIERGFLEFTQKRNSGLFGRLERLFRNDEFLAAKYLQEYIWKGIPNYPLKSGERSFIKLIESYLTNRLNLDCTDLTSLYVALALRQDLDASVIIRQNHMHARVRIGSKILDTEHTLQNGFNNPQDYCPIVETGTQSLIAIYLNKRGCQKHNSGNVEGAIRDYELAIQLEKRYALAYRNLSIAFADQDDLDGALNYVNAAIELDQTFAEAYHTRGGIRYFMGDPEGAKQDFNRAISLDSCFTEARYALSLIEKEQIMESVFS